MIFYRKRTPEPEILSQFVALMVARAKQKTA